MVEKGSNAGTDPELTRQMEAASAKDDAVEAVFILSPGATSESVPSPERTEEVVRRVLARVKSRVGKGEKKVNVFRNLGSFVVAAHPSFLRELISQPEIASAMANQQPGADLVKPVKKQPVPSSSRTNPVSRKKSATRKKAK